ncbi:hypothetical protein SAMD00079811_36330 [Scytonema sp. HK-05]|uniref:hypothetical protein n=1 Tax=Scytonema sp. HK-05 TaxID=1137095 RepID=UPI000937CA9E|nr:hypothetical protein [Scytonema sp. HK-05]OKH60624.1 hypothetical protein NIES2130_02610 [Scytonema sp. HK-05]BAY46026.1 hypothetical protein SAMD00079811_36330 [Scytonema sp. HK-05]
MKRFFQKVIVFTFVMLSVCFLFQNPSFAKTSDSQAQPQVQDSTSSGSQSSNPSSNLNKSEWNITSVPIRPLKPGFEWEVKSEENGKKLVILHNGEEALTLVKE